MLKDKALSKKIVGSILALLVVSMFLSALVHAEGEAPVHNLQVSLDGLDEKNHLASNTPRVVNMTLHNTGSADESGVSLQLLINGTVTVNSFVAELSAGSFFTSNYTWKPKNDGVYNLTLWASPVTNESSYADNNVTKLVKICPTTQPMCIFDFSPKVNETVVKRGLSITFNASKSYNPDWAKISRYSWSFSDSVGTNNTVVTHHTFKYDGLYTVTLAIYDRDNARNSTSKTLTVTNSPIANFTVSEDYRKPNQQKIYYVNKTLTFDASNSINGSIGSIINYSWSFGDGNITSGSLFRKITHQYRNATSVNATLTITNSNHVSDTSQPMTLHLRIGYPVANFTVSEPRYVNETLTFDPRASYDPDTWAEDRPFLGFAWFNWTFGDIGDDNHTEIRGTDLSVLATHKYKTKGTFIVTLTVIDIDNHIASYTTSIEVSPKVTLRVEPKYTTKNPSNQFNISITIEDVEDLKSFTFKLKWSEDLLEYVPRQWINGSFLGNQKLLNGTKRWDPFISYGSGYVSINYTFYANHVPKAERSGSGTLVTITLQVASPGNCTLELDETRLIDSNNKAINHDVEHGYFYTTKPVASFTWSPKPSVVNVTTTFDASGSYDPDDFYPISTGHSLKNYTWNFGGGHIEWTTSPKINYTFTDPGSHTVTLTVTDDDGETWSINLPVEVSAGGDIAVLEVKPYVNESAGWLRMNVTVRNKTGRIEHGVTITFYYQNGTGDYMFNTTVISSLASYVIMPFDVVWKRDIQTRKGNYTIRAVATPVSGESDTTDNNCTSNMVSIRLYGDVNDLIEENGHKKVSILDLILINMNYGKHGPPGWIPEDLNCDGKIDILDVVMCTSNYAAIDP